MKYFILILIASTIYACKNYKPDEIDDHPKRKIDVVLEELLIEKYSNFDSNDIIKAEATNALGEKMDSFFSKEGFDEIPLRIFAIYKNKHGAGSVIQLDANNFEYGAKLLSDQLHFDVIGFANDSLAKSINDKEKYFIYGKYLKKLDETETSLLTRLTYNSPESEIRKSYDELYINAGVFLFEIDSVRLMEK